MSTGQSENHDSFHYKTQCCHWLWCLKSNWLVSWLVFWIPSDTFILNSFNKFQNDCMTKMAVQTDITEKNENLENFSCPTSPTTLKKMQFLVVQNTMKTARKNLACAYSLQPSQKSPPPKLDKEDRLNFRDLIMSFSKNISTIIAGDLEPSCANLKSRLVFDKDVRNRLKFSLENNFEQTQNFSDVLGDS